MTAYLEHANITVPDIDAAIAFLQVLEPHLQVRFDAAWQGEIPADRFRWAHIGAGNCYIALQEPHPDSEPTSNRRPYKDYGLNHIGGVVDDFDAAIRRLEAGGYRQGIPGEERPFRQRAYYYDSADFEWEIIAYLTDNTEERYSYQ